MQNLDCFVLADGAGAGDAVVGWSPVSQELNLKLLQGPHVLKDILLRTDVVEAVLPSVEEHQRRGKVLNAAETADLVVRDREVQKATQAHGRAKGLERGPSKLVRGEVQLLQTGQVFEHLEGVDLRKVIRGQVQLPRKQVGG